MPVTEATLLNAGVKAGLVKADDLTALRVEARRERIKLIEAVTRANRIPVSAMYRALADLRGMKYLTPSELRLAPDLMRKLPATLVQRREFIPITDATGKTLIVLSDPDDHVAVDTAQRHCGRDVELALADPEAIRAVIDRSGDGARPSLQVVDDAPAEGDSTNLLDEIFREAYLYRASDIHFEPDNDGMRVRLRIDGRLQEFKRSLSPREAAGLMTRIKVLANMDIAEQRAPQDGSMNYRIVGWQGKELDVRVATVPTRWGERATLRLFGQEMALLALEDLGMPDAVLTDFRDAIHRTHGIVLVTGPTGSGKTTSLYGALQELNSSAVNILTVEDPVEQIIPGVTQVQVSGKVDFAGTLRSFLRHDPDILLVGEIRDFATADTALKAALTGHLVLATLHTNDAPGALTRLVDIGCEHYLIASTIIGVVAQRLVRRLCPACSEPVEPTINDAAFLGRTELDFELRRAVGCPQCLGTGYQGRVGLFGSIWVDGELSEMIVNRSSENDIRRHARRQSTLLDDGRAKILAGVTTVDEVKSLGLAP